jgi:hypothetical protein
MTKKAYTNAAEWFAAQSFHPIAEAQARAERQRHARAVETVLSTYDEQIAEIDRRIAALAGGAQ